MSIGGDGGVTPGAERGGRGGAGALSPDSTAARSGGDMEAGTPCAEGCAILPRRLRTRERGAKGSRGTRGVDLPTYTLLTTGPNESGRHGAARFGRCLRDRNGSEFHQI